MLKKILQNFTKLPYILALSSLFWIMISIIYEWPNLWYEKSLLQQAPTLPFAEIRVRFFFFFFHTTNALGR